MVRNRRRPLMALVATAMLCGRGVGAQPGEGEGWGSVVAEVNGVQITREALAHQLVDSFGRQALVSMIEQVVVSLEAKSQGIRVTPEEARAAAAGEAEGRIGRRAKTLGMTTEQYGKALEAGGRSLDDLRDAARTSLERVMLAELLARKLLRRSVTITDEQMRQRYDLEYGPKVRVRHIEVATRADAREALRELRAGASLDALARKMTLDTASRSHGFEIRPAPSPKSRIGRRALSLRPGERAVVIVRRAVASMVA